MAQYVPFSRVNEDNGFLAQKCLGNPNSHIQKVLELGLNVRVPIHSTIISNILHYSSELFLTLFQK